MNESTPPSNTHGSPNPQAVAVAIEFVRALPSYFPLPEIAQPEGDEVSLEWDVSETKSASISVDKSRRLSCVCLDGDDYEYGTDYLDHGTIPPRVLDAVWGIIADCNFEATLETVANEENLMKLASAAGLH